jgi:hypothetical protein
MFPSCAISETFEVIKIYLFRGLIACAIFFVLFGVTQTPDGPFIRPHPAIWRLVLCLSVLYEIALIYILFQVAFYSIYQLHNNG